MSCEESSLALLRERITGCKLCARLVQHREEIGRVRRRAYANEIYWSRAVPGFGDPNARVLIVGLAPGAHGANRTGRMFTGDRSGEFLYRALFETGFANQPYSVGQNDGLQLTDAYITAPVRCVPPDNKPELSEVAACRPYLIEELGLLREVEVVVALGGIGMDAYLTVLQEQGKIRSRARFKFGHGLLHETHADGPKLLCCFHPSQQNTSTRRLTADMLRQVFLDARGLLGSR